MSKAYRIYIWKNAPFVRLVLALIVGIIFEFYFKFSFWLILAVATISLSAFIFFSFLPEAFRFKFRALQGIIISLFLIILGLFITWQKDIRHQKNWYGQNLPDSSFLIVTINEPPVEKAKSYKALAKIESVINNLSLIHISEPTRRTPISY